MAHFATVTPYRQLRFAERVTTDRSHATVLAMFATGLLLVASLAPQSPRTVPERTDARATSTNADVRAFLHSLDALPHRARLARHRFGHTTLGEPLHCVIASLEPDRRPDQFRDGGRLRAMILANIHGGEVEGKEAVQELLREIAEGRHRDLLDAIDFVFVPVFNADGNDRIDPSNRVNQNGPERGVGQRHNAQDLDLNRDYVKLESPEVRAQLGLFRAFDPHLYMDLHTTNGSEHGYQLTYAPSLSTSLDPELDAFTHDEFMPSIRAAMLERHGMRTFDYGNFTDGRQGDGKSKGWYTFDHKPRLGWNYAGLRNRISVLSEAYAYRPFAERIAVTRAFVLETARALVRFGDRARGIFSRADRRVTGDGVPRPHIGFDSSFAPPRSTNVLVTEVTRVETEHGPRRIASDAYRDKPDTPVFVRFEARQSIVMPRAWAIVGASDAVRQTLLIHGIEVHRLELPIEVRAECFWPTSLAKPRMRFQGHRLLRVRGETASSSRELPAGTLVVPARQRLARIAALLLDPHSEDSLATWNFFDDAIRKVEAVDPEAELAFPVLRIHDLPKWRTTPCSLETEHIVNTNLVAPLGEVTTAVAIEIHCTDPGRRVDAPFEREARWQDRSTYFQLGSTVCEHGDDLTHALAAALANGAISTDDTVVLIPDPLVADRELIEAAAAARAAGLSKLRLDVKKQE